MTIQELSDTLTRLHLSLQIEANEVAKIKYSPEYVAIGKKIEELMEEQESLLPDESNTQFEYDTVKKEAMKLMADANLEVFGHLTAKYKEKREVNSLKALQALGGDLDMYFTISNITQVALKEFAKENPAMRDDLYASIEVVSRDVSDIIVTV